ncbi:SDR family NAD(P)-dependent oxidoreductase [Halolamina sp.]|uniref:SDR family NAD(P)-dependent oxidoreductase n=1 Tax=Halolamina sp. TaxID=1940283 RepID=UPI0035637A44
MNEATVVVTGAAGGIGGALVRAFAGAGATVVAAVRTGSDDRPMPGSGTDDGLFADIENVDTVTADVRDEFDAERLMERAARVGGDIDLVMPCAGVFHSAPGEAPLDEETYSAFDDQFRTNARGVFTTVKEAVPHLAPDARVLVPSGKVAVEPSTGYGGYAVSKAAAEAVARGFATDIEQTVGVVDPGIVATELTGGQGRDPEDVVGLFEWAATEADAEELNGGRLGLADWKKATR